MTSFGNKFQNNPQWKFRLHIKLNEIGNLIQSIIKLLFQCTVINKVSRILGHVSKVDKSSHSGIIKCYFGQETKIQQRKIFRYWNYSLHLFTHFIVKEGKLKNDSETTSKFISSVAHVQEINKNSGKIRNLKLTKFKRSKINWQLDKYFCKNRQFNIDQISSSNISSNNVTFTYRYQIKTMFNFYKIISIQPYFRSASHFY